MAAHATAAQLADWLGLDDPPADADRLLARASRLVDGATTTAYEADDGTGLATDTDTAEALRDATCAQVEMWLSVGEAHDVEGVRGDVSAPGGLSFTLPDTLAERARRELTLAGLRHPGLS